MLFCPAPPVQADDGGGFYATAAPQLYFSDKFPLITIFGARGGVGWEIPLLGNSLLMGLETGIFHVGEFNNNTPVGVPISLNGLYNYSFNDQWSLNGGLAGGVFFAPRLTTNAAIPFLGPRVSGEWDFLRYSDGSRFVSAYFGGGLDFDFDDGVFVMPLIEAGVRLRFGKSSGGSASSVKKAAIVEEEEPDEEDDYWWEEDEEEEPYTEPEKEPEPANTPPPRTPPPRNEPKVEPAPVVVPGAEQKTGSDSGRFPRGARPVVVMSDGRQGFILEECTIYFGPDLTPVTPQEEAKLRRAVLLLKQYPNERFIVAGYAAFAGTEQGQNVVSWERVRNVTDYLVRQGIKAGRGEAHWFGSDRSAVPNNDRANMALNRRVEIIILDN